MAYLFLDCETTGLNPGQHEIWEIAYAYNDGAIDNAIVQHNPAGADFKALELNGYNSRGHSTPVHVSWEWNLRLHLHGAILVGANPAFDAAMLLARWGLRHSEAPWHYRLFDIEAYAAGVLGWDEPRGLAKIAEALGVDQPNHTAAQDVDTLRQCFHRLRDVSLVDELNAAAIRGGTA